MEYAIRQSAALVNSGVEVVFLCKGTFPRERLADGIRVWEFNKRRGARGEGRASKKQARGLVGKIGRVINMISDLRAHSKQVAEVAEQFAFSPSPVELTTKDTKRHEKGRSDLTTEHTESTEDRFVTKQGSAWASQSGASESDSLASELDNSPVSESLNRSAIGSASESSTRHPFPVTRHRPGPAEVVVLFACYKEYFAPFWVWPLRRLAKKGFVIGTIAHDPVRDFAVGPLWWHRWSVRLGYSFVRHVFVHDDTNVDFGGKRPDGIRIYQIPHGPYEVAEPKIGREAMREKLGFVTTKGTNAHEILTTDVTNGHGSDEGLRLASQAGAAFSNPSTSELARDSEYTSLTRSASITAEAAKPPRTEDEGQRPDGTEGANLPQSALLADAVHSRSEWSGDFEGPASSLIGSRTAKTLPAQELGMPASASSSVPIREIRGSNSEALDVGRSMLDSAPQALSLDARRSTLDSSAPADFVFLAFGQIRDGKNLDLFLRAMVQLPENVKLLVAGKGDSGSSRPPEYYQKLAEELGVADRCRWDIRRIPEEEVGDLFAACDVVLVTYSVKFRSASGVLNAAVSARKPVLASSGTGPLKSTVEKYHLGVFVEPDKPEEILRGAKQLLDVLSLPATQNLDTRHSTIDTCFPPAWARYERENSWDENARRVIEKLK